MKQLPLYLLAAVALTGCPDPGGGGGGNDPAALVGTWNQLADPGAEGETIVFRADGTYDVDNPEGSESGTYTANAQTLTLTNSNGNSEMPYVVDGDRLLGIGLRRDEPGDGFVGEWHAEGIADDQPQTLDLSIRADMTMTFAISSENDLELPGTWSAEAGNLVTSVSLDGGAPLDITWHSLRGALGTPMYQRQ